MVGSDVDTKSNNQLRGCNCQTGMAKYVMSFLCHEKVTWKYYYSLHSFSDKLKQKLFEQP
jgi:hypothetical protein